MTKNKSIFIGLVLIILCVFIFLGYIYYSSTRPLKDVVSSYNPIAGNQEAKTQKPLSHSDMATLPTITKTTSSIIKQDYQPTETEKLFYSRTIKILKPKEIEKEKFEREWGQTLCTGFLKLYEGIIKKYSHLENIEGHQDMIRGAKQSIEENERRKTEYQEILMLLQELIKQYPDSPHFQHYQETFKLIIQMQEEDDKFNSKYNVSRSGMSGIDVHYFRDSGEPIPIDEQIDCYIYCLRNSFFIKTKRYQIELDEGIPGRMIPSFEPFLSGAKLLNIGIPAVPSLLNILDDRRPIIAVDDNVETIPAVFYRYQDAAVEILQRMFIKAKQPFPLELPENDYFSEYLSKQSPENKQKILNDIKAWVEESMKNPATPQQPPESPK
jgi:hypothetical protein